MTFDLTPDQQEWLRRAKAFARDVVASAANAIEEAGAIPGSVLEALSQQALTRPFAGGAIAGSVIVEEIAAVSAGAAAAIGLEAVSAAPSSDLPGLRGSALEPNLPTGEVARRSRLTLCAVAIGVGRAAVACAVEQMKQRGIRPSGDEPTPHWTLADAATEVDAARLLMLGAAQRVDRDEAADDALARAARVAAMAAEHAVEAASLVTGSAGYRRGSLLERLTRDARTLRLLLN